jgi:hypothetical protein
MANEKAKALIESYLSETHKVGDHVTYDWDGPSQGHIVAIKGQHATVKDSTRGHMKWPLHALTVGKLKKTDKGYTTVSNEE